MQRNRRGYALIIILLSLAIMLIVFANMMYWTSSDSKVTARNNNFNMSKPPRKPPSEKVLSQMTYDYISQSLSNNTTYYSTQFIPTLTNEQANWPIQYAYSGTNGGSNQVSVYLGAWTTNTVPLGLTIHEFVWLGAGLQHHRHRHADWPAVQRAGDRLRVNSIRRHPCLSIRHIL